MRGRLVAAGLLTLLVVAGCTGGGADGESLTFGDPAPAFSLPSTDGRTVSLSEFRGKQAALLYFSMGPG